jgi:hypothetical protein
MIRIFAAAIIVCTVLNLHAANEVIVNFKDPAIACDYLIVTSHDFQAPAVMLAQHRNTFKNDDVEHARVAFLEDILVAFPSPGTDYIHRNEVLWKSLKWARENWKIPFRYIVFIGYDAFVVDPTDSSIISAGYIPTWYLDRKVTGPFDRKSFPVPVTDDLYTKLTSASPPTDYLSVLGDSGISVGRIPAATSSQCSLYVEKVKQYDLTRPKGPRRNSVLAIADDAMQGFMVDPLGTFHQPSTDSIVRKLLQGYSVRKRYLSAYPIDQFGEKPAAKTAIVQTINQGISWAFFYGHGNDQVLTDENVLTTESIDWFTNDSMPFVFLSFTSRNGSFLPFLPAPMSIKCLFSSQGGAIAYIGSAYESYAVDNELLGNSFFSELKKTPTASLGALFARAKPKNNFNALSYFLLGDPALRVSTGALPLSAKPVPDSNPSGVQISLPGNSSPVNYSVTFTVRDSILPAPAPGVPPPVPGSPLLPDLAYSCDSAIAVVSGVFHDTAIIALPQSSQAPIKAIVYVWNDTSDGRAEIVIGSGASNAVLSSHQNKAIAQTSLSIRQGNLIISNVKFNAGQIRIFDILGRVVYAGDFQQHSGTVSINLIGKNMAQGRYLLQLRSGANEITMPFMHIAR